jgi:hypothetical protein
MNNTSNKIVSNVIYADLMKKELVLQGFPDATVALFDANKNLKYGSLLREVDFSKDYYKCPENYHLSKTRL